MKAQLSRPQLTQRLRKIRGLLLDVDGVLTDGKLHFTSNGEEFKTFDVQDGHGISMALRAGLLVGFVSGRPSKATEKRAADLGVTILRQGPVNKMQMVETIKTEHNLRDEEICFVGDELVDLSVLRRAGLAVAVPNAVAEVKAAAHYITRRQGGGGAVREVIEMILKGTDRWQAVTAKYLAVLLAAMCLTGTLLAGATNDQSQASGYVEKFEVPQRDQQGNLTWKLSGDRALFRPDGLMDIINCHVELYSSNKVTLVFTTPICVLDRANNRAATDAPVRVEREDMIMTGIGGEWIGSNTTITVRSNVQVQITNKNMLSAPKTTP
jgi:3-deoxy-D-manno-octulosonate 8-phosphate phosphatase (KDO 8-P phosphatase)